VRRTSTGASLGHKARLPEKQAAARRPARSRLQGSGAAVGSTRGTLAELPELPSPYPDPVSGGGYWWLWWLGGLVALVAAITRRAGGS
jgi:hypothetical protein